MQRVVSPKSARIVSADADDRAWKRRPEHRAPELLAAARALFEERGYRDTSMAEIAGSAGVSEATAYKYFRSKQNLMHAVICDWMEPAIGTLEREVAAASGAGAKLEVIAARHLGEIARTPGLHRVVYRELRWADYYGSPLHRLNQRYTGIVLRVIEDGIASGELRADADAELTRDLFFGGLEHVGWRTVLAGRPLDLGETAAVFTRQIMGGLLRRSRKAGSAAALRHVEQAIGVLQSAAEMLAKD